MWYLRLDHSEPQALEHLVNYSKNAQIQDSIIIKCNSCAAGKISQKIQHEARDLNEAPGEQLAINFHNFKKKFDDWTFLVTITDHWSGLIWDYYLTNHTLVAVIQVLKLFFGYLNQQFKIKSKMMKMNRKLYSQKPEIRRYLEQD